MSVIFSIVFLSLRNLLPDLLLCLFAAHLTGSGWQGFLIAFLALQGLYFALWIKATAWSWLLFWLYAKEALARHIEKILLDCQFPSPHKYTYVDYDLAFEDYLRDVYKDEELEIATRLQAAAEVAPLETFRKTGHLSKLMQFSMAGRVALRRYASKA